jgi:hypothetical protein
LAWDAIYRNTLHAIWCITIHCMWCIVMRCDVSQYIACDALAWDAMYCGCNVSQYIACFGSFNTLHQHGNANLGCK